MLVTGCIFCLQLDGPITGVRAYELGRGGGGHVSGSLRNGEINLYAITFLYFLRSLRQSSVR